MSWNFKRDESETYEKPPEGKHRVMITSAEMGTSKAGNDMLVLKLAVSGYTYTIWNYIVFMEDKPEITNRKLTQLFDSFGIEDGDFNLKHYVGKVGGAKVKHDKYGAKIHYFLDKKQTADLPPWKGEVPKPADYTPFDMDGDLPFN